MKKIVNGSLPLSCDLCEKYIAQLCSAFPRVSKTVIGRSILGRKITALNIGKDRPATLVVAGHHAAETLCSLALLGAAEEFLKLGADGAAPALSLVFLLNPDGAQVQALGAKGGGIFKERLLRMNGGDDFSLWQANVRGVDLNHNYDAGFKKGKEYEKKAGISGGPTRYSGEYPESEPETAALCAFVRARGFERVVALHSQGREIYCDNAGFVPKGGAEFAQKLARALGYSVAKPSGHSACGGFKDWFIAEFNRPGLTIELGFGRNPLPQSDYGELKSDCLKILKAL